MPQQDRGRQKTHKGATYVGQPKLETKKKKKKPERLSESCQRRQIVMESWCRMVGGKGRRGISFAWRQHRFFFVDFLLLLALSYEKLDQGDRKGKGGKAWGWDEAHRVRFTLQHCCCALFWTFTYGTYTERSPRCSIFP